jgi:hypothetical protein
MFGKVAGAGNCTKDWTRGSKTDNESGKTRSTSCTVSSSESAEHQLGQQVTEDYVTTSIRARSTPGSTLDAADDQGARTVDVREPETFERVQGSARL